MGGQEVLGSDKIIRKDYTCLRGSLESGEIEHDCRPLPPRPCSQIDRHDRTETLPQNNLTRFWSPLLCFVSIPIASAVVLQTEIH